MSNFQIENALKSTPFFAGVFLRDELTKRKHPQLNECGVVNLHTSKENETAIGHWVCYSVFNYGEKNQVIIYTDPIGNIQPPVEVIKYLGKNIKYNYLSYMNIDTFHCGHVCVNFILCFSEKYYAKEIKNTI